jgi:hypothetical protein
MADKLSTLPETRNAALLIPAVLESSGNVADNLGRPCTTGAGLQFPLRVLHAGRVRQGTDVSHFSICCRSESTRIAPCFVAHGVEKSA